MTAKLSSDAEAYLQGLFNGINSPERTLKNLPVDHQVYLQALADKQVKPELVEVNLSPDQQSYLQGLRHGDIKGSQLVVREKLSPKAAEDLLIFESFLKLHGIGTPTLNNLSLTISRTAMLSMLFYADDRNRNCLILQSCFGCSTAPERDLSGNLTKIGQIVLVQKGNFQQFAGQSDVDLFFGDTVFRNEQNEFEFFINMDLTTKLTLKQAAGLIDNFLAIYPADRTLTSDPFIHGYLLPVKALIKLFTESGTEFSNADKLKIKWGLTSFNQGGRIGNFTLVISPDGMETGPIIEFRSENIKGTGAGDCPPKTGCNTKVPS